MADWNKLKVRGKVEDRRGNTLPSQYTRPIVIKSVPNVGLPRPQRRVLVPGEKIEGLKNNNDRFSLKLPALAKLRVR